MEQDTQNKLLERELKEKNEAAKQEEYADAANEAMKDLEPDYSSLEKSKEPEAGPSYDEIKEQEETKR